MPTCLANGISLYYEETGHGMPVVFIHGHTLTAAMWDPQWQAVAAGYRAVRYDLRGHGRSDAPVTGYTLQHHADDLCALLDYLGVPRAVLVGLSIGGGIAVQVACTCASRVAGLVLVDSTLDGYAYSQEHRQLLRDLRQHIRTEGVQAAMEAVWLPSHMFSGVRRFPDRFAAVSQMVARYSGADYLDEARYAHAPWRQSDRLGEIEAPALVVIGEGDVTDFQGASEALSRGIRGARKVTIGGAQHIPTIEQPEAFNAVLLDFLAGISA